jgi:hypothetical protein
MLKTSQVQLTSSNRRKLQTTMTSIKTILFFALIAFAAAQFPAIPEIPGGEALGGLPGGDQLGALPLPETPEGETEGEDAGRFTEALNQLNGFRGNQRQRN